MISLKIEYFSLYLLISPVVILGALITYSFIRNFQGNRSMAFLLGSLFFTITFVYLIDGVSLIGFGDLYPHILLTSIPISLCINPLIYLIVLRSINKEVKYFEVVLHFIPALFTLINFTPFWLLSGPSKLALFDQLGPIEVLSSGVGGLMVPGKWVIVLRFFLLLFYFLLLLRILMKYRIFFKANYNPKRLVCSFFVYLSLKLLIVIYLAVGVVLIDVPLLIFVTNYRIVVSLLLMVYFFLRPEILYSNYWHKGLSKLAVEIEEIDTSKNPDSPKQVFSIGYSSLETNSDLSSQEKKRLIIISGYLEETRPYLDQKFSAKKIEEDLNISSKNIGNIIKKNFKMNFNQYVNKLRIEYALSQLESYPKWRAYTIEALANNVGFNSANSFYAYFKEYTGMTPREYILKLELAKMGSDGQL